MRTLLTTIATVTLLGCSGNAINIDIPVKGSSTIKGAGLAGSLLSVIPFSGSFSSFNIADTQEFKNQGAKKENIDSAKMKSLKLTVTSGDSFEAFLTSITFYAEADGQPKKRVATKTAIDKLPVGTKTFDCDLDDVDLKGYVTAPSMKITTEVAGKAPTQDTVVEAQMTMAVGVKLF